MSHFMVKNSFLIPQMKSLTIKGSGQLKQPLL